MRLWNEFSWFSLVRSTEGRLANWTIEWASVFRLASTHPSMWIVVECKANPKWLTPNAISLLNEHYYYSITPPNTVNSTSSSNDTRRHLCDENDQEELNYSFCLFAKWCQLQLARIFHNDEVIIRKFTRVTKRERERMNKLRHVRVFWSDDWNESKTKKQLKIDMRQKILVVRMKRDQCIH